MSNEQDAVDMDHFDLDEWVKSVEDTIVKVTTPDKNQLGFEASRLYASKAATPDSDSWCEGCEDYFKLIKGGEEVVGHCPSCGEQPGMLELGTKRGLNLD